MVLKQRNTIFYNKKKEKVAKKHCIAYTAEKLLKFTTIVSCCKSTQAHTNICVSKRQSCIGQNKLAHISAYIFALVYTYIYTYIFVYNNVHIFRYASTTYLQIFNWHFSACRPWPTPMPYDQPHPNSEVLHQFYSAHRYKHTHTPTLTKAFPTFSS